MNDKRTTHIVILWFLIAGILFSFSCTNLFENLDDAPKSVTWIQVKTGLTDSFAMSDERIKNLKDSINNIDTFAKVMSEAIDTGGFTIQWNGVHNADYYEIRLSKSKITLDNWSKAVLVEKVDAQPVSRMSKTIRKLTPSIEGNNCTGCEYCYYACPNDAITMFRKKAIIDVSECTGCGKCYDTCNYDAVTDISFGESYYFAVRSFSKENVASAHIASTIHAYLLRYVSWHWRIEKDNSKKQICGACGDNCFILDETAQEEGCPVGAILYDATGSVYDKDMVYIDQDKCIYCGKCVRKCILSHLPNNHCPEGFAAIRREVICTY